MLMDRFVSIMSACTSSKKNISLPFCSFHGYRWANATLGEDCVVENTAYTAYTGGSEFIDIVSRHVLSSSLEFRTEYYEKQG